MNEYTRSQVRELDLRVTHRLAVIDCLRKALRMDRGDLTCGVVRELVWEIARLEREADRDIDCMVDIRKERE